MRIAAHPFAHSALDTRARLAVRRFGARAVLIIRYAQRVVRIHCFEVTAKPDQVRVARQHVARILGPEHPCLDSATEVTSELVTNAILYGSASKNAKIAVRIHLRRRRIHLTVADEGGTGHQPTIRRPDGDALNGRGLLIVANLARRWGWARHGSGHKIWVLLDPDHPEPQANTTPQIPDLDAFLALDSAVKPDGS
jgi:anti-sigma regulatory factor (Ser/Thr protein kinase)